MSRISPPAAASPAIPSNMKDSGRVVLGNKQAPATMRDTGNVVLGNKQAPANMRD